MHSEFDNLFDHSLLSGTPGGFLAMPARMDFPFHEPTSFSDGPRRGWASDSFITTTVNGVTQTIHKLRDWDVCAFPLIVFLLHLTAFPGY